LLFHDKNLLVAVRKSARSHYSDPGREFRRAVSRARSARSQVSNIGR
jgi:hypothetical protein